MGRAKAETQGPLPRNEVGYLESLSHPSVPVKHAGREPRAAICNKRRPSRGMTET